MLFDKLDTAKMHGLDMFDVSSASRRARRAVLFDKLDTAKMHGPDTSNMSCRDVTSQVEFELYYIYKQDIRSDICIVYTCTT